MIKRRWKRGISLWKVLALDILAGNKSHLVRFFGLHVAYHTFKMGKSIISAMPMAKISYKSLNRTSQTLFISYFLSK
jgi:hypothetical protein